LKVLAEDFSSLDLSDLQKFFYDGYVCQVSTAVFASQNQGLGMIQSDRRVDVGISLL
jgi:hypothetical protein